MVFQSCKAFNEVSLAKQCWGLMSNPDSLIAQVLKVWYYPRKDVLSSSVGYSPSFIWRSIHHALWVLKNGGLWRVGIGEKINIWKDNWLPVQTGFRCWSTPPSGCDISFRNQLWFPGSKIWNANLIKAIFLPFEADLISQIPTSSLLDEDNSFG